MITTRRHREQLAALGEYQRKAVDALTAKHKAELTQTARMVDVRAALLRREYEVLLEQLAAGMLERRADAFDIEADHLDKRPPGGKRQVDPLTAGARRVIADELRTIVRDARERAAMMARARGGAGS